jgi:cell wall-associated NlpC family hydrolase
MKRTIILALLILAGCGGSPRYRTGGEEHHQKRVSTDTKYDTDDYIRFGKILQSYLGKPYKGTSKYEAGLDCSHFTQSVFKKFDNIKLPRTSADQYKVGRDVKYKHLTYGDLVFFKTSGRKISHVGIYIDNRRFIHASSSKGVIISGLGEKYWAERYVGARRVLD